MGCGACSAGGCSTGGCRSNGGCKTGGCNKLNAYDWLAGMEAAEVAERFPFLELRFKGGRKEIFKQNFNLELNTGDAVVVDLSTGQDMGFVSLQGEIVRLQMKRKGIAENEEMPGILRKALKDDFVKYEAVKGREIPTLYKTREIINGLGLKMKLSDVDFQLDGKKATFYYSADDRVDFRELIKQLANEFKIRVEMKQISLRQESGRLGGIGVCGRELCCSTWLSDFKSVNTSAAKYQNLSLNPQKLSGQCGRLKCCLNYELDTYMEALKGIPEVDKPIATVQGDAVLQKTDIFRKIMWFSFNNDSTWLPVSTADVARLIELNKKGIKPQSLDPNDLEAKEVSKQPVKLNSDIQKLDDKLRNKKSSGQAPHHHNHHHKKKKR